MPELPEVETTVRGLSSVLEGERLAEVIPRRADLRRAIPMDIGQRLTGSIVVGLGRRAKYGFINTDRGDTLIFHLGMSGRWRVDPEDLGAHDHLLIRTEKGRRLTLNDPRRFGSLDLVETKNLASFPPFKALGPEPLGPDLTVSYLEKALSGRISAIKVLLLDQRIIAGLGNIYVCEALNMAKIAPTRSGGRIMRTEIKRLIKSIQSVLEAAIAAGGSSLRDYVRPDGELGYFSKQWRVYGRELQNCPCGGIVARRIDGGRSTFFCPKCQV